MEMAQTVIIGGGPTGLSAAYHLGPEALLLEGQNRIGGWCRSIVDNGFTFDYAGHIMFSKDPYVHELYKLLLGDNVHWQDREAWVYSKNVFTRYPFQGALYGLPPEVIKECLVGAIEARFGALHEQPQNMAIQSKTPTSGDVKDDEVADCCADGTADAFNGDDAAMRAREANAAPRNFEEFIYKVWGAGIARHFAIPYNRKIWAVDLTQMETSWLGGRVPLPDLEEIIDGALSPVAKPMGPNARFGYPLHGGFQALMDGFLPLIGDQIQLNARVTAISPSEHMLTLDEGSEIGYEQLISTMPLPVLIQLMGDEAPPEMQAAAQGLRHTSVRCVNIGVGRENLTEKHWIYYPEDTVFHRIFVQGNASPHCNPVGGFGLTCEITYGPNKPLPCDGDELIQRCIDECIEVGLFTGEDPIWATNIVDMPYAYVIYDHGRKANVDTMREWLLTHDIVLSGRYSEWEYYNSDHAFIAGRQAAEAVQQLRGELSERAVAAD